MKCVYTKFIVTALLRYNNSHYAQFTQSAPSVFFLSYLLRVGTIITDFHITELHAKVVPSSSQCFPTLNPRQSWKIYSWLTFHRGSVFSCHRLLPHLMSSGSLALPWALVHLLSLLCQITQLAHSTFHFPMFKWWAGSLPPYLGSYE